MPFEARSRGRSLKRPAAAEVRATNGTLEEDLDNLLDEIAEDEERLAELGREAAPQNPIADEKSENEESVGEEG